MAQAKKRAKKPVKKVAKRRKTTKDVPLTRLDFWAIACNEVYMACRRAGMDEGTALAFAMDRSSYPEWIVDNGNPMFKPWDEHEDED